MSRSLHGHVFAFERDRGFGSVRTPDGDTYFFHATQLTSGSRDIAAGAEIVFRLTPGEGGRLEAVDVTSTSLDSLCPVCSSSLPAEPRSWEICRVCGWEDDPVQFDDPSFAGGANGSSLNEARVEWARGIRR